MPNDASKPTIKTDGVAEKIAEKLYRHANLTWFKQEQCQDEAIALIRAEILASELVYAAREMAFGALDSSRTFNAKVGRLRAALKALEEQPGALGKGKDAV